MCFHCQPLSVNNNVNSDINYNYWYSRLIKFIPVMILQTQPITKIAVKNWRIPAIKVNRNARFHLPFPYSVWQPKSIVIEDKTVPNTNKIRDEKIKIKTQKGLIVQTKWHEKVESTVKHVISPEIS